MSASRRRSRSVASPGFIHFPFQTQEFAGAEQPVGFRVTRRAVVFRDGTQQAANALLAVARPDGLVQLVDRTCDLIRPCIAAQLARRSASLPARRCLG